MAGIGKIELRLTGTVTQGDIVERNALRDAIECRIPMEMVDASRNGSNVWISTSARVSPAKIV